MIDSTRVVLLNNNFGEYLCWKMFVFSMNPRGVFNCYIDLNPA